MKYLQERSMQDRISVLVIAHNEEAHIAECIDSILSQSQKPDEIVLVVHNSTDWTLEIAQKYQDIRVVGHLAEEI